MKRLTLCLVSLILCFVFASVFPGKVMSQPMMSPQVAEASICTDVVDRACENANTRFSVSTDKLYCFTRIVGAQNNTYVTHVWYYGDRERAQVRLSVRSPNWRTFSSKMIQPHEIGQWHVDVLGADGQVLTTVPFSIQP